MAISALQESRMPQYKAPAPVAPKPANPADSIPYYDVAKSSFSLAGLDNLRKNGFSPSTPVQTSNSNSGWIFSADTFKTPAQQAGVNVGKDIENNLNKATGQTLEQPNYSIADTNYVPENFFNTDPKSQQDYLSTIITPSAETVSRNPNNEPLSDQGTLAIGGTSTVNNNISSSPWDPNKFTAPVKAFDPTKLTPIDTSKGQVKDSGTSWATALTPQTITPNTVSAGTLATPESNYSNIEKKFGNVANIVTGQQYNNANDIVNRLQGIATGTGPSASAQALLNAQALNNTDATNKAQQTIQGALANARSSLASRGGLSSGARERLATSGATQNALDMQNLLMENNKAKLGILSNDEAMKLGLLQSLPETQINLDKYNTDLAKTNQAKDLDIVKSLSDLGVAERGQNVSQAQTKFLGDIDVGKTNVANQLEAAKANMEADYKTKTDAINRQIQLAQYNGDNARVMELAARQRELDAEAKRFDSEFSNRGQDIDITKSLLDQANKLAISKYLANSPSV